MMLHDGAIYDLAYGLKMIEPFNIDVPDPVLADLRRRIRDTRWPPAAPGPAWSQDQLVGVNAHLQILIERS